MIDTADTIDWADVMLIDCETRSFADPASPDASVMTTSTSRYAAKAYPIIITWGLGLTGEVKRWEWTDFSRRPTADDLPREVTQWDGYFMAWHSGFDRAILDRYMVNGGVKAWLDAMAQAAYNNLPLGLDRAAKACGYEGKMQVGKSLIKLFCSSDGATPQERPEDWAKFCEYADVDVLMMQNVCASSFPVPFAIWEEFWASERINDRGLPIDVDMARGGAKLAEAYAAQTNERVAEITKDALYSVRQYAAQQAWVWDRIKDNPFLREPMVQAERDLPDGTVEYKLKMDRPIITRLIAALNTLDEREGLTDDEYAVLCFLEEREYGASAAPAKFQKMLDMAREDGTLPNQYTFAGATQTGRYSSRGVQVHNMTRSTVGDIQREESVAVFMIEAGETDAA